MGTFTESVSLSVAFSSRQSSLDVQEDEDLDGFAGNRSPSPSVQSKEDNKSATKERKRQSEAKVITPQKNDEFERMPESLPSESGRKCSPQDRSENTPKSRKSSIAKGDNDECPESKEESTKEEKRGSAKERGIQSQKSEVGARKSPKDEDRMVKSATTEDRPIKSPGAKDRSVKSPKGEDRTKSPKVDDQSIKSPKSEDEHKESPKDENGSRRDLVASAGTEKGSTKKERKGSGKNENMEGSRHSLHREKSQGKVKTPKPDSGRNTPNDMGSQNKNLNTGEINEKQKNTKVEKDKELSPANIRNIIHASTEGEITRTLICGCTHVTT